MYLYFNSQGVLKEVINDTAIRQGDATTTVIVDGVVQEVASDVNSIYFFIEGADPQVDSDGIYQALTFSGIKKTFYDAEGTQLTEQTDVSLVTVEKEIPYDKKRELTHFKYFTKYEMFRAIVPNDVTNESGTIVLKLLLINTDLSQKALGPIVFNVEYTGGKAVVWEDTAISVAQWNYLVSHMVEPDDLLIYALKTGVVPLKTADNSTTLDDICENQSARCFVTFNNKTYYLEATHVGGNYICYIQELGRVGRRQGNIAEATTFANALTTLTQRDYIDMTTNQDITGVKTIKNRLIIDGFSGSGVISLYESNINTNNKNSFAKVWVDSANYVNYDLPYGPSDAGQNLQTHTLATKYYVDQQINEVEMESDVIDIVGTYADLQAYDTQHVKENDLIKVISDSTHNNATSYYRWISNAWVYVASEGPYYTTSQADNLFVTKTTQIAGVQIGSGISAQDLTNALVFATDSDIESIMED